MVAVVVLTQEEAMKTIRTLVLAMFAIAPLFAQTTQPGTVQSSGTGSVDVIPDQASFTIGVTTQGTTAQEASSLNASQTNTMIGALNAIVGKSGTVQTVSYSVSPRYSVTGTQRPIIGYTANNTVQVVTSDLAHLGQIIDAGTQAGGTNISGINFGLSKPDPYVQQALGLAAKQALAHAAAIASGLGAKTGAVVSAQETSNVTPYRYADAGAIAATTTPVQTGNVSVSAYVSVAVQLLQ